MDGNVWHKQTQFEKEMNHGTSGAHTVVPFQCERCWFVNLEGRLPIPGYPKDDTLKKMMRRVNLDIMNGRATSTIKQHANEVKRTVRECAVLGKTPSYEERGPLPMRDTAGMGLAIEMVNRSCVARTGRINEQGFLQWDTLRKMRATSSKVRESSRLGVEEMSSFSSGTSKVKLTQCPTQSEAFAWFALGAERRMGAESKADKALSIQVILRVLELIKREASTLSPLEAAPLWKCGAAIVVGLMGSLRGPEIWMLDLAGIRRHIRQGKLGVLPIKPLKEGIDLFNAPFVTLCLLGKFKGENGTREHMIAVASTSRSGIEARWWVEKLIEVRLQEGCTSGPAFGNADGTPVSTLDMNAMLRHYLGEIQHTDSKLIPPDDDVIANYSFTRSLRKAAQSSARAAGLKADVQDAMNRWKKIERAQGRRPRFNMRDHYSNVVAMMPVTWRYSYVH